MLDNFEKNIAHQLNQFQLQPSVQVWKGVEAALDKKPTRKIPFFWWIGICGVLLGGGYWLYTSTNQPNKIEQKQELKSLETNTGKETTKNSSIKNVFKNGVANTEELNKKEINNRVIKSNEVAIKNVITKEVKTKNANTKDSKLNNPATTNVITKDAPTPISSIEDNSNKQATVIKEENISTGLKVDSTNEIQLKTNTTSDTTNISSENPVKLNYTNNIKRGHWFLTTGAGITNQSSSGLQQSFAANDPLAFANLPGSGSSAVIAPAELVKSNSGFHALVGIGYEKVLGKRWSIDLALQYRYVQNYQAVGLKIDTARNFNGYNTVNGGTYSADYYYQGGNTQTIYNYSHWLSLPFALYYNLHQTKKNKLQVLLGGTPTWNIAQKWLVRDENTKQFYYAPAINNKFNLSVDIGIRYVIKNDWSIAAKWSEGLTATTQLTNNKTYWNSLSFQFNKTIVFSSKKRLQK